MAHDEGDIPSAARLWAAMPGSARSVGGLAREAGGSALSRPGARSRQACDGPAGGAGRPEGPADEGGPAHLHHPRRAAAGICPRARAVAGQRAGHGLGLRAPPHGDRARARLAIEVRQVRQGGLVRRLAGPGPSRDAAPMAPRLPSSCSIPTWRRRWKPTSTSSSSSSRSASASIRPSAPTRSMPRSPRACARNWTTGARPGTWRSIATCCATSRACMCPRSCRRTRPTGCSP